MKNEEAIETLKMAKAEVEWSYPMDYQVAFDKAIEALELSKNDGFVRYMGKTYIAKNPVFKTIDGRGVCSFYGFKGVKENEG